MAAVLGFLFACGACLLIHWLLNVYARRTAEPQVATLRRARASAEPFSCDVPAHLTVRRPGQRLSRYSAGTVHVRPASVSWQSRSRRHHLSRDMTGATLLGESSQVPLGVKLDYVAACQISLRHGDYLLDIRLRRPLAPLVTAGLDQAAAGRTPSES
jgi:hypothetical protein